VVTRHRCRITISDEQAPGGDMRHESLFHYRNRRPNHLNYYLDAGLAAGAAAFSSLAGTLFAGTSAFLCVLLTSASFFTSAFAGADAGALDGSAAKADTATDATRAAISLFMIFSFKVSFERVPFCNSYS